MQFTELKKELDKNNIRPFYVFLGTERILIDKYLERLGVKKIYDNFDAFCSHLLGGNLFGLARKAGFSGTIPEDFKWVEFKQALKQKKATGIIVLTEIDKRKKVYKLLEEDIVQFNSIKGESLVNYVTTILKITPELAARLVERCGQNLSIIDNEANKLKHCGEIITTNIIDSLVIRSPEEDVFKLFGYILEKRIADSLMLYNDLIQLKVVDLNILGALYRQYTQLFIAKGYLEAGMSSDAVCTKMEITMFWLRKICEHKDLCSLSYLKKSIDRLLEYDIELKSGSHVLFEELILELCQ